jgi:plastocyanin
MFHAALVFLATSACAQSGMAPLELHARIQLPPSMSTKDRVPAAVVWLDSVDKDADKLQPDPGRFTLLQKNRMFSPHLLVVPLGSVVRFPNADPFFHNVFSLFNGKRFDLGLYEAGTSKEVMFSREGVSYIFCNIHPEMSAVILSLATPLFGVADQSARVTVRGVTPGDYVLHVWVEGLMQPSLDRMTRRVKVEPAGPNQITIDATNVPRQPPEHLNKFGQPYDRQATSPY